MSLELGGPLFKKPFLVESGCYMVFKRPANLKSDPYAWLSFLTDKLPACALAANFAFAADTSSDFLFVAKD